MIQKIFLWNYLYYNSRELKNIKEKMNIFENKIEELKNKINLFNYIIQWVNWKKRILSWKEKRQRRKKFNNT